MGFEECWDSRESQQGLEAVINVDKVLDLAVLDLIARSKDVHIGNAAGKEIGTRYCC